MVTHAIQVLPVDRPRIGSSSRVVIVAAYPALRAGLRALLDGQGIAVVAEASDVGELIVGPRAIGDFDVALVDLEGGISATARLAQQFPELRVVLLGTATEVSRVSGAFAGRPWGCVPREASPELLAGAVRAVSVGLLTIEPSLATHLVSQRAPSRLDEPTEAGEELTSREREVLNLVAAGLSNKMIANRLGISEHTVKFHVAAILAKLGAASRTEASHLAARRGLIAL